MISYATKGPLESKTIIAAIITLIASLLAIFGYTFTPEDQAVAIGFVSALTTAVGAVVAIYGRIKATKAIKT